MWKKKAVLMGLLFFFVGMFVVLHCDKKSSTEPEENVHEAWFPPDPGWTFQYNLIEGSGNSFEGVGEIMGMDTQTYPGEAYLKIRVGVFTEQAWRGVIFWLDLSQLNRVAYKAAEVYYDNLPEKAGTAVASVWNFKEVWEPPLVVEYTGATGVEKSSSSTGYFYFFGDMSQSTIYPTQIDYTLTSKDVAVAVPYGTVTGCYQLDMTVTQTDPDGGTFDFSGTNYLHPALGMVKSEFLPGFMGAELTGANGLARVLSWLY